MSNFGQAALTIVGAVVGSYFGYPQLGLVLGSLAGQALFPTKLPGVTGPKLTDQVTTTATIGGAVPITWGTVPLSGTVIYLQYPVREESNTQTVGGKGGPTQSQTTFTYFQTIAVGLCEGVKANPGIRRVWENGLLVYDKRPRADDEALSDYNARVAANAKYEQTFVYYPGSEEQLPDPTIESLEGVGNVPAFRGLAYIVYPDRQLLDTQARRHPTFRFEVFDAGTVAEVAQVNITIPSTSIIFDQKLSDYADANDWNTHACEINVVFDGGIQIGTSYLSSAAFTFDQIFAGSIINVHMQGAIVRIYGRGGDGGGHINNVSQPPPPIRDDMIDSRDGVNAFNVNATGPITMNITGAGGGGPLAYLIAGGGGGGGWGSDGSSDDAGGGGAGYKSGRAYFGWYQGADGVSPTDGLNIGGSSGTSGGGRGGQFGQKGEDGNINLGGAAGFWLRIPTHSTVNVDSNVTVYGQIFHYAAGDTGGISEVLTANPVSVREIIEGICVRSGLRIGDIDATEYTDMFVGGYFIATLMAARDALTPIRSVGFFDVVQRDRQLYFSKRGKPVVDTLVTENMGCFEDGGQPPPAVTTTPTQDVDLPRQLRIKYLSIARDYEPGEQLSPMKITTGASANGIPNQAAESVEATDVEIAVCLDDTQAAQIVEILWADAWAGKWKHEIVLDRSYLRLLPGDALSIPVDDVLVRARALQIVDKVIGLRTLTLVRDDDGSYVSQAVAAPPLSKPPTMKVTAGTRMVLLDLPPLRLELDNSADLYAAGCRDDTGNSWPGAIVSKSIDGGATWVDSVSLTQEATVGTLVAGLPSADPAVWDTHTEILVDLFAGSFESRTRAAVLSGANTLAVGAPGRWLIVQFVSATKVSASRWSLKTVLQGTRGTEYLIGTTQANDRVVLVSGPGMVKIPVANSEIGQARKYRAVTAGLTFADGVDVDITPAGQPLKPFSPVAVKFKRETNGNITVSWTRRDRLVQTLRDGVPLAMSEAVESYQIDIIPPGSPDVVSRTLTSATDSVTYDTGDQADDFPGVTSTFRVGVYQISAVVGRGIGGFGNSGIAANPDLHADIVIDARDKPMSLGWNHGVFIGARVGKRGTSPAVGIYAWDPDAATATFIGTTFDNRFGAGSSYVPDSYFEALTRNRQQYFPTVAAGINDKMVIWWAREFLGIGPPNGRWMLAFDALSYHVIATATALNEDIVLLLQKRDGTFLALVAGSPCKVYSSTDGRTWTFVSNTTGAMPNLTYRDQPNSKAMEMDSGAIYAIAGVYGFVNAAGDMIDWASADYDLGTHPYGNRNLLDIATNGPSLVALMEVQKLSDGQTYNTILRSTDDGASWAAVREVLKAGDIAPGFAFALEWLNMCPFDSAGSPTQHGFAIYGKYAGGGFPYVMISEDDGATWTTSEVDTGDPFNGAIICSISSRGRRIFAVDTYRTVGGLASTRFSTSTDGIHFTGIAEFNQPST